MSPATLSVVLLSHPRRGALQRAAPDRELFQMPGCSAWADASTAHRMRDFGVRVYTETELPVAACRPPEMDCAELGIMPNLIL